MPFNVIYHGVYELEIAQSERLRFASCPAPGALCSRRTEGAAEIAASRLVGPQCAPETALSPTRVRMEGWHSSQTHRANHTKPGALPRTVLARKPVSERGAAASDELPWGPFSAAAKEDPRGPKGVLRAPVPPS